MQLLCKLMEMTRVYPGGVLLIVPATVSANRIASGNGGARADPGPDLVAPGLVGGADGIRTYAVDGLGGIVRA